MFNGVFFNNEPMVCEGALCTLEMPAPSGLELLSRPKGPDIQGFTPLEPCLQVGPLLKESTNMGKQNGRPSEPQI